MKVRPFEPDDEPILREIHDRSGYDFPFPENLKDYFVVIDDAGCPIMAAGSKLVPEVTLLCAPGGSTHPLVKLKAISLIHEKLRDSLKSQGHTQAFCFVPPELGSYRRHLQRHFNWKPTWQGFAIGDWGS
jgi:hypothetical protein